MTIRALFPRFLALATTALAAFIAALALWRHGLTVFDALCCMEVCFRGVNRFIC